MRKFVIICIGLFFGPATCISAGAEAQTRKVDSAVKCKDENGNDIDWFFAYKLPTISDSIDPQYKDGSAYYYILPGASQWKRSIQSINDSDSIVGVTMNQLYNDPDLAYLSYNDQPFDRPAVVYNGHTKGLAMAKADGGIWLVHSVPHFPTSLDTFGYPTGGLENGQMFLCLTLSTTQFDMIGEILQYTKPNVYNFSVPSSMQKVLPNVNNFLSKNLTITHPPWFKQFQLSVGNLKFNVFAKGPKFRKGWIAPTLRSSLDVQSWLNGAHPFHSNCTSNYSVMNILTKIIGGQNFTTEADHAKWGVGVDDPWSCIADLNRMKPQKTRGGVAVCVSSKGIWSAFKSSVNLLQPCNRTITDITPSQMSTKRQRQKYKLKEYLQLQG